MLQYMLLFVLAGCSAQVPGGIFKINNTIIQNGSFYYNVLNEGPGLLSLRNTSDLNSTDWSDPRVILSKDNKPIWVAEDLQDPDIEVIGPEMVRIYFAANDTEYKTLAIGVAYGTEFNQEKEYETQKTALLRCGPDCNYYDPGLILLQFPTIYLVYIIQSDSSIGIWSSMLNSDGLSIESLTTFITKPELSWEGNTLKAPWGLERDGYIYIFYQCEGGVGVVRRRTLADGEQYEKMLTPLLEKPKSMPSKEQLLMSLYWLPNGWPIVQL